jgi:hypothetical protein
LVVPENELHQQKIADSLGDSVAFAQKNEFWKSCHFITYRGAEGYRHKALIPLGIKTYPGAITFHSQGPRGISMTGVHLHMKDHRL